MLGVLSTRTRREEGFSSEDLSIASAFAVQAAVALDGRLGHETRRAYDELAQTQEQLTQARKMEAIGQLAGIRRYHAARLNWASRQARAQLTSNVP